MTEMVERFWSKVDRLGDGECWRWIGLTKANRSSMAYGSFRTDNGMRPAHRVSFQLCVGAIPDGLIVRHKCDNPLCVNPSHLETGTHKDNVADRYKRGRAFHRKGQEHGNAKLTEDDVRSIRVRLANGESQRSVAASYGISQFGVRHARDGWKHVK